MNGKQTKPAGAGFQPLSSIFGDTPAEEPSVVVTEAALSDLYSFKNHPFHVKDDKSMEELMVSIEECGVLHPIIVRPRTQGGYEIIAGHRRKRACERLGLTTIPIDVRDVSDYLATVIMINTNCQREAISFSEKAFAYKRLMDEKKHQGKRSDLTSAQLGPKSGRTTADEIALQVQESRNQIKRYIRLTELTPHFLDMVDNASLPFNTGVELSYVGKHEQQWVADTLLTLASKLAMAQATQLKEAYQKGELSQEAILSILKKEKKTTVKIALSGRDLQRFFPSDYTSEQMQSIILTLLEQWAYAQNEGHRVAS